jgi:hypothetical protein
MGTKYPDKVFSKIVGTTFDNRQEKIVRAKEAGAAMLHLEREPENAYDPDAIGVWVELYSKEGGYETIQLGYISNSEYACADCGYIMPGRGKGAPSACSECDGTEFDRIGLATQLAQAMDSGISYTCKVLEYTGGDMKEDGTEKKNRGVNIFIEMLKITEPTYGV